MIKSQKLVRGQETIEANLDVKCEKGNVQQQSRQITNSHVGEGLVMRKQTTSPAFLKNLFFP